MTGVRMTELSKGVLIYKCENCGMISNSIFVCHHGERLKNKAYSWNGDEWWGGER